MAESNVNSSKTPPSSVVEFTGNPLVSLKRSQTATWESFGPPSLMRRKRARASWKIERYRREKGSSSRGAKRVGRCLHKEGEEGQGVALLDTRSQLDRAPKQKVPRQQKRRRFSSGKKRGVPATHAGSFQTDVTCST